MAAVRPAARRSSGGAWWRRRDAGGLQLRTAVLGAGLALGPCVGLGLWAGRQELIGGAGSRRQAAEAEVCRTILAGEGDAAVLAQMARQARRLMRADRALAIAPDLGSGAAVVAADTQVGAVAEADALLRRPPFADALRWRAPRVVPDVRLRHGPLRLSGTGIVAPLSAAGRPLGVVLLVVRGRRSFKRRDIRALELFADTVAAGLDYARPRRDPAGAMIVEERERIASELHDGVIKTLFGVGMLLQGTAARVSDRWLRERLEVAVGGVDRAINDLRSHVFALGSPGDGPSD